MREREVPLIVDIKNKHVVIFFFKKNPSQIPCLLVLREIKSEYINIKIMYGKGKGIHNT